MRKFKQFSLLFMIMWMHPVLAYQSQANTSNLNRYGHCVTVENNSNDAYTVKYIFVPNKSGRDWTNYYLHPKSSQPFCYNDSIYYGIAFDIIRNNDGYEFYYGRQSDGTITIPADSDHT